MKMLLKDGKMKVLTLSYDDGVVQDIRLMEIMNRHGLKGTFNINTGIYLPEDSVREKYYGRLKLSESIALYKDSGHEVAVHGLTHPWLERLDSTEVVREIVEDRRNIERDYNVIARGMAYPFGTYNDEVITILEKCGIAYARTTKPKVEEGYNEKWFAFPENWLELHPTCHHNHKKLMELAEAFLKPSPCINSWMFYLWGHSYEFDNNDNWDVIEKFAELMGGREDIWYATNIEIYDYVMAYKGLQTNYEKTRVHNPSAIDVWFRERGNSYCVKAGETLVL